MAQGREEFGLHFPKVALLSCLAVTEAIRTFGLTPVYNKALGKKYTLSYKKKKKDKKHDLPKLLEKNEYLSCTLAGQACAKFLHILIYLILTMIQ